MACQATRRRKYLFDKAQQLDPVLRTLLARQLCSTPLLQAGQQETLQGSATRKPRTGAADATATISL